MKNKRVVFFSISCLLIGVFLLGAMYYKNQERKRLSFLAQENSSLFVKEYSPVYGDQNAKVFLIEFLDPECESCRLFYPSVKKILEDFKGKVKLVVRYAPFHRNSVVAIRALEAARKQNKYWQALDILFKYQPAWGDHHNPRPELIFEYLAQMGLDMDKLKADMADPDIEAMIKQEVEDLKELKVRGTPTFFVNGRPLEHFSMESLRTLVKDEVDNLYN